MSEVYFISDKHTLGVKCLKFTLYPDKHTLGVKCQKFTLYPDKHTLGVKCQKFTSILCLPVKRNNSIIKCTCIRF